MPHEPNTVVLYAGDNDIAAGKSPQTVRDDFKAFVRTVHESLPKARIVFIAIKPSLRRWSLVEKMREANALIRTVIDADADRLAEAIGDADENAKPWLIWAAATKAFGEKDYDTARRHLETLRTNYASHILCSEINNPPQVREEKEQSKEEKKKTSSANDEPDLRAPLKGSAVSRLEESIAANESFRTAHPSFFKAPDPDASETAVIKFNGGEIEIAFYPKAAKEHVARFKKSISGTHYVGMHVHKIKRAGSSSSDKNIPITIHLGNSNTRDKEDPDSNEIKRDRTKWAEKDEAKEEDILEFESGEPSLSCFPFAVCAETEDEGKSSAVRFFICINDCASAYDGEQVVFGKVIRGMEFLKDVADGDLADLQSEIRGEGRPSQDTRVESTELRKK